MMFLGPTTASYGTRKSLVSALRSRALRRSGGAISWIVLAWWVACDAMGVWPCQMLDHVAELGLEHLQTMETRILSMRRSHFSYESWYVLIRAQPRPKGGILETQNDGLFWFKQRAVIKHPTTFEASDAVRWFRSQLRRVSWTKSPGSWRARTGEATCGARSSSAGGWPACAGSSGGSKDGPRSGRFSVAKVTGTIGNWAKCVS